jgi:hypothetical protein
MRFIISAPEEFKPKNILDLLDEEPMVGEEQLQLWDWMSSYYMCSHGEVMRAALPSGLRPESESKVQFNPGYEDEGVLDSHERLLLEVVKDEGELSMGELQLSGISRNPMTILKHLVDLGAVEVNEFIRYTVTPKTISYLRFAEPYRTEQALHSLLDQLTRAPKQRELVEQILDLTDTTRMEQAPSVRRREVAQNPGASGALRALIKKGILEQFEKEELGQEPDPDVDGRPIHSLNQGAKGSTYNDPGTIRQSADCPVAWSYLKREDRAVYSPDQGDAGPGQTGLLYVARDRPDHPDHWPHPAGVWSQGGGIPFQVQRFGTGACVQKPAGTDRRSLLQRGDRGQISHFPAVQEAGADPHRRGARNHL